MFKSKLSKVVSFLMIFGIVVSLSFTTLATDETTPLSSDEQSSLASTNNQAAADDSSSTVPAGTATDNSAASQQQNIVKHDVYMSGDDVTMDQLVDGNVFVTGKNVTITGQVNGNLFVAAETVTFTNSYVVNTAFIAAETVNFDAAANDIYCACKSMTLSYDSYIVRDVHIAAKDINFLGYVGRNANMAAQTINLGNPNEEKASAYITGDLDYSASKVTFHSDNEESTVADNDQDAMSKVVSGEVKANITNEDEENQEDNSNKVSVIDLLSHVFIALIVYLITIWLFPKKIDDHVTDITNKPVKSLGYGALALIFVPLASILLLITFIGAPIGLFTLVLYGFAILFAKPVVNVALARLVKNKFNLSNIWLEMLAVIAIAIILWAISLIPYINIVVRIIIALFGLGFIVLTLFPDKNDKKDKTKKVKKAKKETKKVEDSKKEDKE